ncbi:restriction endonuclease subunit S [Aristaeella hokkaidonensis]|uniref:Restriction endonuclease subunit S n=1 Tax=Aristaeella hokkaidonensis TaxID=3046382 RepID=A0AC61MUR6_9FIRM|nr:restriction endonuclease subunit S [Aristaeella hokkaidonensis]QUC66115.1 restriction endonuclease subunit S [Aristaeella hokkaidonensis]SNT94882.1 type I restriction enzyme, S subunit [Aristaeella hokkaidonensis]
MIELRKLSDVADLTVGYVGTMGKEYSSQGVLFLRSLNIKPFGFDLNDIKYIPSDFHMKLNKSALKTNDVVIVRTGVPGTCAVIPPELDGSNCADLVIVRPHMEKIDPYYLCAFINSWGRSQVSNVKVGAIQKHFNVTSAEEMLIPMLNLNEQKKIASFLRNLNDKIYQNNGICADLEAMTKLLYDYWFVQFDFPDENGKPYKSSGGKMVWNNELKREIPEGWEVDKFDDLVDVAPKLKAIMAPDYQEKGEYPIIDQASNLITGYTDDKQYLFSNETGCVVFGDVTTHFKFINFPFAKGTDGTKIIRAKNERIPALLLYHLIKNCRLPNVGFARHYMFLREVKVLVPPKSLCLEYECKTRWLMEAWRLNIEENQQLVSLRDFLLPMLINGQVKVSVAE